MCFVAAVYLAVLHEEVHHNTKGKWHFAQMHNHHTAYLPLLLNHYNSILQHSTKYTTYTYRVYFKMLASLTI